MEICTENEDVYNRKLGFEVQMWDELKLKELQWWKNCRVQQEKRQGKKLFQFNLQGVYTKLMSLDPDEHNGRLVPWVERVSGSCFLKLFITAKPWYTGRKKKIAPCGSLAIKKLTACPQVLWEDGPKYFPQQEKWESSAGC